MKYTTLLLIFFVICVVNKPQIVFAESFKASGSSATFTRTQNPGKVDNRSKILKEFLEQYNSPLSSNAEIFVREADKNGLDYRLVASIAGVESTFAHQLPYNSYNAWGWGIYGDNMIRFNSYEEAITTISLALRTNYINKWQADDVYKIGKIYAASPTWADKVTYFMNRIEDFEKKSATKTLLITL